jgi:virginiamycin B lyase
MRKGILSVVVAAAFLCSGFLEPVHAQQLPEGAGRELVEANCSQCHGLDLITSSRNTEEGWRQVSISMVDLPESQLDTIVAYLGARFPARSAPAAPAPAQAQQLPEGTGQELVETTCSQCHRLNLITNSWGNTEEGWRELVSSMIELPKSEADTIAAYLGAHFPVKPAPEAVVIPGDVSVSIKEWVVPSLGSRPHDPLAAADGSLWWTGQWASVLGRLDPATGVMKEYPLPPGSGPHGLVEDATSNIWFTGISQNYVGKLDPRTGEVTQYPVSGEGVRGPHTPILDQNGTVWFTLQSGHVGRLVPKTGEMKIAKTPSDNTYPYGIVVNSKGVPWYVDFRGNRLGSVDPETMEIREHTLPSLEARPRRVAITPDDVLWYTDYARGYLGRFDPASGEVQEWPSPGGPESQPYGISAVGNIIWYSESSVRPNTLVRFDTESENFQTWVIPSGGGVVRNMMATSSGNLVLACSGVNRVALVEVGN